MPVGLDGGGLVLGLLQRAIVLCLLRAPDGRLCRGEVERRLGADPFAIDTALISLAEVGVIELRPDLRLLVAGEALQRLYALGLIGV